LVVAASAVELQSIGQRDRAAHPVCDH